MTDQQKNIGTRIVETKARSLKSWSIALGIVLVAALAAVPMLMGAADSGGEKGHSFDITFTKWVTVAPNMVGVVGGAVGDGTFSGEITGMSTTGNITNLTARYHINGSQHSFDADIQAAQDNLKGTGEITGKITAGWLKGNELTGAYNVVAECPIETLPENAYGTMCFQGVLHVVPGP